LRPARYVRDNEGMRTSTLAFTLTVLVACASSVGAAPLTPMRVLVTNDDGVGAPGIDALVQQLAANPNLQVTVIAPATNQSLTGDNITTTGSINVSPSSTAGAFPATAVAGFPADTVLFGVLEALPQPPDLVVSGINLGQNAGQEIVDASGTVGAALTAARLGIPAIAVSHGLTFTTAAQFAESAIYTARLVERFRVSRGFRAKMSSRSGARFALVLNVNFPRCTSGATRGVVLVPMGPINRVTGYTPAGSMGSTQTFMPTVVTLSPFGGPCTSGITDPATDAEGLANGFATLTPLNPDLTSSQKIRTFRFLLR
jgi:5'-nucleotidase